MSVQPNMRGGWGATAHMRERRSSPKGVGLKPTKVARLKRIALVEKSSHSFFATANAATLEEERRLHCVAMTRANSMLELIIPQDYSRNRSDASGDLSSLTQCTCFLPGPLANIVDTALGQTSRNGPRWSLDKSTRSARSRL